MAERRMFAKAIIDSDAFLDMPLSTQALYFHLAMRADDDGFVSNPRRIVRLINAADDDFKLLVVKRYILTFDSGIIVIKHWKIHNYIRNDRYKETTYIEEKSQLILDNKNSYTEAQKDNGSPLVYQAVDNRYPQVSIGKDSIELGKDNKKSEQVAPSPSKRFVKPTLKEVQAYCEERNNNINPQNFIDFYESKGWKVGNQSMKDWKACVRTWEQRERRGISGNNKSTKVAVPSKYNREE